MSLTIRPAYVRWPDYDRRDLWAAIQTYVDRERRYGGAVDAPTA